MNQLKKDSKEFAAKLILNEDHKNPPVSIKNVYEIKTLEDWKTHVIQGKKPIVLDCYADWCKPCKQLEPILLSRCKEAAGDWVLIKLNIDKMSQIASALQLKSVPTVLLIHNGNVIDGFTGVEQASITRFFEGITLITKANKEKALFQGKIEEIEGNLLKGNDKIKESEASLEELFRDQRARDVFGARILAILSLCAAKQGKKEQSLLFIYEINQKFSADSKNEEVQKFVKLAEEEIENLNKRLNSDPRMIELMEKLEKNPADNGIRYELAEIQLKNGLNKEAIENCLDIMKSDRNWSENKAQKLLISIFGKLGSANSLVVDGRKKMQRILY